MSLTDPIGDMIARIKNAQMRNYKIVKLPFSKFKTKIAQVLKSEGFIIEHKISQDKNKAILEITLKYSSGNPVISSIQRVSKPGRRIFSYPLLIPIIALLSRLLFIPHNLFVFWVIVFGLIETSFPSLIINSNISVSISNDFFPVVLQC